MANKLAGQRAKFTQARQAYNSSDDENNKNRVAHLMAEVLVWARDSHAVTEDVTQRQDYPDLVRRMAEEIGSLPPEPPDDERLVQAVQETVDQSGVAEFGIGPQCVYAYGYPCAPDRLKVGRCDGDVITGIAGQIGTSTPDKPVLFLRIRTDDCRSLEKALHGILQVRKRKVVGGGDEWFQTKRAEIVEIYKLLCVEPND